MSKHSNESPFAASELRFIKYVAEFQPLAKIDEVPTGVRGIYALLKKVSQGGKPKYNVVYVGMARGAKGVKYRLRKHRDSETKGDLWTHFSVFAVWNNIPESEVAELEGLFRHIYRKDTRANAINVQKTFKKLKSRKVRKSLEAWV
jgi:hypothetical protein